MSGTEDQAVRRKQLTFTFEQMRPLMDERIMKQIACGILALRDGGDSAGHTLRYKNEWLPSLRSPLRLDAAGKAWRAKGRYGRLIGVSVDGGLTLAGCIARREPKTDHVKIINSGLNSLTEFGKETSPQFGPEELDSAVRAARARGQKTMVHANGTLPVRFAVEARCTSIEHGFFMGRENMERMAELQIFWVSTAFSMRAFSRAMPPESLEAQISAQNLDHQLDQIRLARELGVPVVLGTDSGGFGLAHGKAFIEELRLIMEAGYPVEEAVRCASLEGARLLGIEREVGQLKRGAGASFVAVQGPPSELPDSLHRVECVYVRGVRALPQNP
jgi:hypothetical protein